MGSDAFVRPSSSRSSIFQSTLPAWGATDRCQTACSRQKDFNPRSPHGERPNQLSQGASVIKISIHAPRMGSDTDREGQGTWCEYFNPRSPHGERQLQSHGICHAIHNFNPRSPHGERLPHRSGRSPLGGISIHAPRMGSDFDDDHLPSSGSVFQSTLPAWGATHGKSFDDCQISISIHAPRMGSDGLFRFRSVSQGRFQSTLPAWGATAKDQLYRQHQIISIHAPRMGSDSGLPQRKTAKRRFQSTLPAWGATAQQAKNLEMQNISIHAPRMGSDAPKVELPPLTENFNPRSPHGERQYSQSIQQ